MVMAQTGDQRQCTIRIAGCDLVSCKDGGAPLSIEAEIVESISIMFTQLFDMERDHSKLCCNERQF